MNEDSKENWKYIQFPIHFLRGDYWSEDFRETDGALINMIMFGFYRATLIPQLNISTIKGAADYFDYPWVPTSEAIEGLITEVNKIPPKEIESMPSIKFEHVSNFYDPIEFLSRKKQQQFREELAAYIAIKSIIGPAKYKPRISKEFITARMFGFFRQADPLLHGKPGEIQMLMKMRKRSKWDGLIERMEKWHLSIYSGMGIHGYYIGLESKISKDELAYIAEKGKKKNRPAAGFHQKNKELKKKVQERIESENLHLNKQPTP